MHRAPIFLFLALLVSGQTIAAFTAGPPSGPRHAGLAQKAGDDKPGTAAYAFLKKYCADCHTGDKPKSEVDDYDVLSYASLTKKRIDDDKKEYFLVKAGSKGKQALDGSKLWQMMGVDKMMPPKKFDKKEVKNIPSDKERDTIKNWLEAGAPKEGFGPAKEK
jgi:hypothetical protein